MIAKNAPEIETFIREHIHLSVSDIALKLSSKKNWPTAYILQQVNGLKKSEKKLPSWAQTEGIHFPPARNLEQCSSELTATFKAGLVSGLRFADLTGGFGVDYFFMGAQFSTAYYVEPDVELATYCEHNTTLLDRNRNVQTERIYVHATAEEFLQTNQHTFDFIYIDPSRRKEGNKVFRLEKCLPNVINLMPLLLQKAKNVLIKTSSMLDITQALKELKNVQEVYSISLHNESKELLFSCTPSPGEEPIIHCIAADKPNKLLSFRMSEERNAIATYSQVLNYLYEPDAAVTKAGAFTILCEKFSAKKIAKHSHLYSSETLIYNFPGRVFKVQGVFPISKQIAKENNLSAGIWVLKNTPYTLSELEKKSGIKSSGVGKYLFATKDTAQKPIAILCEKS